MPDVFVQLCSHICLFGEVVVLFSCAAIMGLGEVVTTICQMSCSIVQPCFEFGEAVWDMPLSD